MLKKLFCIALLVIFCGHECNAMRKVKIFLTKASQVHKAHKVSKIEKTLAGLSFISAGFASYCFGYNDARNGGFLKHSDSLASFCLCITMPAWYLASCPYFAGSIVLIEALLYKKGYKDKRRLMPKDVLEKN